ncbi:class I tRNA ligase family protein, partial [Priestia megaterium]|uniref:class I tRNA ligase family protein n=1 Tax=Priestia megaterium TaxID=1404 RepID=UPI0035B6A1C3
MERFDIGEAARVIYEFLWGEYCDWYIELCKPRLYGTDEGAKNTARHVLWMVLKGTLELLHPYMPFITEEI